MTLGHLLFLHMSSGLSPDLNVNTSIIVKVTFAYALQLCHNKYIASGKVQRLLTQTQI